MIFHGLWTILFVILSTNTFAQDSEPDLSALESIEQNSDTSMDSSSESTETLSEDIPVLNKMDKPENLDDQSKKITLKDAIEEGLRRNNLQKARDYEKERNELDWQDNYADFWYPQLSLKINTQENLVDNLYTDVNSSTGTSKTANGYVGLEFDNYTVFNWGKDYLDYLNNKNNYKRFNKSLEEKRRALRFQIIGQYFNLARSKRILQVKKSQLRHSSFIYRLAKEKFTLKKINAQEYLQTKAEFLRSHAEYQEVSYDVADQERQFAYFLGDDMTTSYSPIEQVKFVPLTTKKDESYRYALTQSPEYLEAKKNLENSNRSFQKVLKENMPLPKFDLKLGAYRHNLTDAGVYDSAGLDSGSRNVELVASINMTWKIFGSGGLFNNRVTERSYLSKRVSEIEFFEAKRNVSTNVNVLHRKIRFLEKQVEANQAFVKNARTTFDRTLDNYISGKTIFPNIKMVLDSLILSEVQLESSKYQHILNKLKLAEVMGVDDFPGENFEKMVMQ